jgi:hypothetical protein
LQPFVQILGNIPNTSNLGNGSWGAGGKGPIELGGLQVVNGQLLGTEYVYYDNSWTTVVTHFRDDSLNLSAGHYEGMFQVGNSGAGNYDGYMSPIPSNWQAALGAPYLTGNCCLNVIGRTSWGPAAFGFNPSALTTSTAASAKPYVDYTSTNEAGGNPDMSEYNPLFDGDTTIQGVLFVPGTRTVLFFGSVGTNSQTYGEPSTFNDIYRTGKGYHSLDGDYAYQVWAYDADDFLAVEQGQKQPWQIEPYAIWNFDFPQPSGAKYLGGVTFDPSTGRLYVTQLGADTEAPYSYLPVVQVFQLTLSPPGSSGDSITISSATGATPPAERVRIATPSGLAIATREPTPVGTVASDSVGPELVVLGSLTPDDADALRDGTIRSARHTVVRRATMDRTNTLLRLTGRMSSRVPQGARRIERHAAELHPRLMLE